MAAPHVMPFTTEAAEVTRTGAPSRQLHAGARVDGRAPEVFPRADAPLFAMPAMPFDAPPVRLTTHEDVVVRGRSNLLTTPGAIVRHGLYDLATEVPPEEFYNRLGLDKAGSLAAWMPTPPFHVDYLPEAAVFTDGVAFNYAHWLTEVLPRLVAFVRSGAGAGVPLIIDTDLHANIQRSIALVAGEDVPLYRLAPNQAVRVGRLHNVSPAGFLAFKPRQGDIQQGVFHPVALRESVAALGAGGGVEREPRLKLFTRRRTGLRRIVNEAEIEEALTARGFVAAEPERLSLDEQVALFSRASMVVGATGAAMTNLIFCQPDCPTIVMMPRFPAWAYWYWLRMAAAAGAGPVLHVSGPQINPLADPFAAQALHVDFTVDVQDVLQAVEAAEAALV